jgi:hypothetical protein
MPQEAVAAQETDRKVMRGREFASVLVFKQGDKVVAEPAKGAHTIAMKKNMRFAGDLVKCLDVLKAAFPGCTFAWEK